MHIRACILKILTRLVADNGVCGRDDAEATCIHLFYSRHRVAVDLPDIKGGAVFARAQCVS